MVDDKEQNSTDEFDNLDEEIELDLFADDDEQSADEDLLADEDTLFEHPDDDFSSSLDSDLEDNFEESLDASPDNESQTDPGQEFEVELDDGLDSDLDDDIIDLSDEEVAREFAELELEESPPQPQLGDEIPVDDSLDVDSDTEADDIYKNITSEEFGAPDQYTSESGAKTESKPRTSANTTEATGMPAMLAALAGVSPRMMVAVTAAVLLPVVIFTALGFNSDESDADEAAASPFQDGGLEARNNEAEPASDSSGTFSVTRSTLPPAASEEQPVAQAEPEPSASDTDGTASDPATVDSPISADSAPDDEAIDSVPPTLLAQTQTQQPTTQTEDRIETATEESDIAVPDNNPADAADTATSAEPATRAVTSPPRAPEPEAADAVDTTPDSPATRPTVPADTEQNNGLNYHVIVASFPNEAAATQHAERISDADRQAYVIPPFGDASNYRVAIAAFASMAEARENIPGLRDQFGTGIWPLRYPPSQGIRVVDSPTGETYIIVASFPNTQLARTHADGLVRRGEQPVIIAPYPPSNRYRVAVSHFDTTSNAQNALPRFRENYGEDAWLLRY